MRFFLVGGLIWKFGAPIKVFIDKYFNILATLFTVLLIGFTALVVTLLDDDDKKETKSPAPTKVEQSVESDATTAISTTETITTIESCDTLDL